MKKKTALVLGASRGIGRTIALEIAKTYNVVVSSKTELDLQKLTKEIINNGGSAFYHCCNVMEAQAVNDLINFTIKVFGSIDVVIYNSGAIFHGNLSDTSIKKFQLLQKVNVEGLYFTINFTLPIFKKQKCGRLIVISPPIYSRFFRGKCAYAVGKVGMSVLVSGLAMELEEEFKNQISVTALWPATAVESAVTTNVESKYLRSPLIFSDAVLEILKSEPAEVNGKFLIDEDFLRSKGQTDFLKYSLIKNAEVPRMMPKKFPSLLVEEQDDRGFLMKSNI
ncbi:hypothetical protein HDU92_002898 [Lobulomyces angularis]|nr:hypothetical protein HDU92_002898 [Lobulomyces angularis]